MTADSVEFAKVMEVIDAFIRGIRAELQARWTTWQIDLTKSYIYEVIGGLVAREVTLAAQLAAAPQIWNGHIAPLILRSMTDGYITLAWIFEEPGTRADQYIKFGLGQRKLWLEHFKADLTAKGEKDVDNNPFVKAATERLNAERFEHLTEVSIGSWSEQSTRDMAEQAGCLGLYRFAYTPFSAAVHNMWHHIADYNLERCSNPLHQFHRVPVDPELEPDIDYVYRAAKYVEKTFSLFDKKTGIKVDIESSLDLLVDALTKLGATPPMSGNDDEPN
jgi:hypothetical protein